MTAIVEAFLKHVLTGDVEVGARGVLPDGARWQVSGEGIIELAPRDSGEHTPNIMVSVGVHGDETAPIEICDAIIRDIAAGVIPLAARVMFVFANVAAMRQGRRYLHDDLNRLFRPQGVPEAATLSASPRPGDHEGQRAAELEVAARRFFGAPSPPSAGHHTLHLDLHTAIRPSRFVQFALHPYRSDGRWHREELDWLADHGIEAVLLNAGPAGTFAYFTSAELNVPSFTLELGKALPFGQNDHSQFASIDHGLRRRLAGELSRRQQLPPARIFRVVHVLTKRSDRFVLHVADDVANFHPFPQGTVISEEGDERYVVSHSEERIVFPNRHVKNGLRAGLMVVETTLD